VALAAVLSVLVLGHEDASTALLAGALSAQAGDLVALDLVVLKHSKLNLLVLVGDLLRLGVHLLLALLATTTKAENKMEGGLLLNVVVAQGAAILELFTGKDQALLIRGDT